MTVKANTPTRVAGLVGRFFHVFGEDQNVERQGLVLSAVGSGHFLIQYFGWWTGGASTMAVVAVETMTCLPLSARSPGAWQFYETDEHMRDWLESHRADQSRANG